MNAQAGGSMGLLRVAFGAAAGLPVALFAHTMVFGDAHVAGGAFHLAVTGTSLVLAGVVALLATGFAIIGGDVARDGSAAAAWAFARLAPTSWIAAASAGWFAAVESLERPHAIPLAATALSLWLAARLVRTLLAWFVRSFGAVCLRWRIRRAAALPVRIVRRFRSTTVAVVQGRPPVGLRAPPDAGLRFHPVSS